MIEDESSLRLARAIDRLSELIEERMLPLLERIASTTASATVSTEGVGEKRVEAIIAARESIARGDWARARVLVENLEVENPEIAVRLTAELAEARRTSADRLRSRIDSAREADDAEQAVALRDELQAVLEDAPDRELDRSLAHWIMSRIQNRLLHPPIGVEVPRWAALAAERFADTKDGASLRKALPILRRSAGLCPRCAEPFPGEEDACPACLAKMPTLAVAPAIPTSIGSEPEADSGSEP